MEYFYVMGRVTRGRGGRYREGRSFDEERGSPITEKPALRVIQRQRKFDFKGRVKIEVNRSEKLKIAQNL